MATQSLQLTSFPFSGSFNGLNNFGNQGGSYFGMPSMNWGSNPVASAPNRNIFGAVKGGGNLSLYGGNGGWGGLSYGQWGMQGMQALGSLMDAYTGYKTYKLQKKAFQHQQAMDLKNMENTVNDYNRRLEERYTTAYAGRGDMTEDEAKQKAREYREENGLKGL